MSDRWNDGEPDAAAERPARLDLREDHPELYGALLALNERIDRSGGRVGWILICVWVLTVVAIIGAWVPEVFGSSIHNLQSFWVYALLAVLLFATNLRWQAWCKRRTYRAGREEIELEMARARLSTNRLIELMHGKDSLELVAAEIKGDADFDTRRR